jgi:predicted Zn-dependent protease
MQTRWCTMLALITLALATLIACREVEGTGRQQLVLVPEGIANQQGAAAYQQVLQEEQRSNDQEMIQILERIGRRLAAVAPDRGYDWEFTLLESPQANAFALPGGKVAVYTGILPYAQTEAGLATVIGHEIAHAIARHGSERMSQGILLQGGGLALDLALQQQGVEPTDRNLWMGAFAMSSQLGVMLPYSRKHELEADQLGLIYMAKAGYDPRVAPEFWERFASESAQPEFLSTHPHSDRRSDELQEAMDEALQLYRAADQQYGTGVRLPQRYQTVGER